MLIDGKPLSEHLQTIQALRRELSMGKDAYSIREFCQRYGLSPSYFYLMQKRGEGPAVMRVGHRTLISLEAANAWRLRLEAASSKPELAVAG